AADPQRKLGHPRRDLLDGAADLHDVAFVDLAQEKQRDVHGVGIDPLHLGPGFREGGLQVDGFGYDALADVDRDEGADAAHGCGSSFAYAPTFRLLNYT